MSPLVAIIVMLNNYVHDLATGLLLVSALWLGWSARELGPHPSPETLAVYRRLYTRALRFVLGSIAVIVGTGVPRLVFFHDVEWFPALGRGLAPVLYAKHALAFTLLGVGGYAWLGLRRRLAALPGWGSATPVTALPDAVVAVAPEARP